MKKTSSPLVGEALVGREMRWGVSPSSLRLHSGQAQPSTPIQESGEKGLITEQRGEAIPVSVVNYRGRLLQGFSPRNDN